MSRPEGWEKIKFEKCEVVADECECEDCQMNRRNFEAGADAMLEGLRGKVSISVEATDFIHNNSTGESLAARVKGRFVFIPEEE